MDKIILLSVDKKLLFLELRYITERIKRRISAEYSISKSAWDPVVLDLPPGEKFLVLAPHPDDDAIGCGGTIIKLLTNEKLVRVSYLSIQSSEHFSRAERLEEIRESLDCLGVTDFSLREDTFPSGDVLVDMIKKELISSRPDTVFVPSPVENHDHHVESFLSYLKAHRESGVRANTLLYEVWAPLLPNILVDITSFIAGKNDAIGAHKTQIRNLDFMRAAKGLNAYRAAMSGRDGYSEAFLFLAPSDLHRIFDLKGLYR